MMYLILISILRHLGMSALLNDHNNILTLCGKDVSEGKCDGLKGKKPEIVDDDECEISEQGSKKCDGRKAVNENLSKAVKERWNKKKENEKKNGL
nr:hypothetical protein [Tanacetum cinerariifolium]